MRTINILNSIINKAEKDYSTTATTWNDLLSELQSKGLYNKDMIAMIKENKQELRPGHNLPVGLGSGVDFTLFLLPSKNKAGYGSY